MYSVLDTKAVNDLSLMRHGWFNPEYELTDGFNIFCKMSYHWFSPIGTVVQSATDTWVFQRENIFTRSLVITDVDGRAIGKVTRERFSRKSTLSLNSGFQADFYAHPIFSRENIWESSTNGKIIEITSSLFSTRDGVRITPGTTPANLVPLLIFLGKHLIILRRRRKSRH
ncbi:hypothetical protein [Mucilaginibacter gotjawali]|uniref:Uncharacterized protein n=2 Tax=Mucilaginibacter gotjawali TaxID=1550579 RepID=A0A839SAL9_9SPHI|nr:hypothetical protein [Mucilaginibacter gotjawali]MBB3054010.1 hypothetical protein [Mucilaginibacter gotjawali]BAU54275.1 hypothetical protein MgSA37_02449 [Mucilaginibacter gotjawali]